MYEIKSQMSMEQLEAASYHQLCWMGVWRENTSGGKPVLLGLEYRKWYRSQNPTEKKPKKKLIR